MADNNYTDEEVRKFGTLKAIWRIMDDMLDKGADLDFIIKTCHLFDGQNEYTLKFFPNGDSDIMPVFKIKNPSELDESFDEFPDLPFRSYLECCCYVAWNELNK